MERCWLQYQQVHIQTDMLALHQGAELLVVKLKQSKQYLRDFFLIKDDVPAFEESDIMLALRFLEDYAIRLGKPLIIIFGLGSANGSRTGASPLAEMMENLTKNPIYQL